MEDTMKKKQRMSRRDFVRTTTLGGVAAVLPLKTNTIRHVLQSDKNTPKVEYRKLGRTGLKVSVVGYGAMRTSDPNVIHHALDLGINYIDTAHCYMGGNNEVIVGNVLKSRRKETYIATKVHIGREKPMLKSMEDSLKSLKTDVVDVIQLHGLETRREVLHEEAMNALEKMREKGMARFVGFTTHDNQAEVIETAIESNFYDVILVAYNFKGDPAIGKAINKAMKAGIGIVGMKTQAGGYKRKGYESWSPHQAALRWILENTTMATTISSMVSFAQVDDNIKAMGTKFSAQDQEILNRYGTLYDSEICRMCGSCKEQCRFGVPIPAINRCLMYAEGYEDYDLALRTYRELSSQKPVSACDNCQICTVQCKYGLDIPRRLKRARENFGTVIV